MGTDGQKHQSHAARILPREIAFIGITGNTRSSYTTKHKRKEVAKTTKRARSRNRDGAREAKKS